MQIHHNSGQWNNATRSGVFRSERHEALDAVYPSQGRVEAKRWARILVKPPSTRRPKARLVVRILRAIWLAL